MDDFSRFLSWYKPKKCSVLIVLVGKDFWQPIWDYSVNTLRDEFKTISPKDMDLFQILDNEDEIMKVITSAPKRGEHYS